MDSDLRAKTDVVAAKLSKCRHGVPDSPDATKLFVRGSATTPESRPKFAAFQRIYSIVSWPRKVNCGTNSITPPCSSSAPSPGRVPRRFSALLHMLALPSPPR